MHPSSPSEAFQFTGFKDKEVSSTSKVLTAGGGGVWNAGICKEFEGLSAWTGRSVTVKKDTDTQP